MASKPHQNAYTTYNEGCTRRRALQTHNAYGICCHCTRATTYLRDMFGPGRRRQDDSEQPATHPEYCIVSVHTYYAVFAHMNVMSLRLCCKEQHRHNQLPRVVRRALCSVCMHMTHNSTIYRTHVRNICAIKPTSQRKHTERVRTITSTLRSRRKIVASMFTTYVVNIRERCRHTQHRFRNGTASFVGYLGLCISILLTWY